MLLCEEYLKRHSIDIPWIKHTQCAVLFYKDIDISTWLVQHIEWHHPEFHPGSYSIETLCAYHNGFNERAAFRHINTEIIQWDEYEPFLLEWLSTPRQIARTPDEITIASWEMIIQCWDRGLIRHIHFDKLTESIDHDVPLLKRLKHIDDCLEYFSRQQHEFVEMWQGDFQFYRDNYAQWMADMVVNV